MPHMQLQVTGKKYTSREGDHPDDEAYIEQVKAQLNLKLTELGFIKSDIKLEFT